MFGVLAARVSASFPGRLTLLCAHNKMRLRFVYETTSRRYLVVRRRARDPRARRRRDTIVAVCNGIVVPSYRCFTDNNDALPEIKKK